MKKLIFKLLRLVLGQSIMGFAMAMAVQSSLGLSPWDVLNDGVSNILGVEIGTASILFGIVLLILELLLREKVGFGTFINILLIGGMCNLVLASGLLPGYALSEGLDNLVPRLILCVGSMICMSFGMYLYMSVAWGSGPRDTLMVMLTRRTRLSVGGVRLIVEGAAFVSGYLLGGKIGLGSVLLVLLGGPIMEIMFRLLRFDVKQLRNQTMAETLRELRGALAGRAQ